MQTYLALVRGINVAGHRQVAMADLRDLLTTLGFVEVRSLLQSGNLIFRSHERTGAGLERLLEEEAKKRLDLHANFFLRSTDEWKAIVAHNPFRQEAERDPSHLVVMFLKDAPGRAKVKALEAANSGPEVVCVRGRHAYIVYPNGIGRSRLTHAVIEKTLGTRGTGRNWNTVLKVHAFARA